MLHLLHHLCPCLLGIVLRHHGGEPVHIQRVLPVGGTALSPLGLGTALRGHKAWRNLLEWLRISRAPGEALSGCSDSLAELIISAPDKFELLQGYPDALQHGFDDVLVVTSAQLQQLPGSFHVVQVSMEVSKEDCHLGQGTGGVTPGQGKRPCSLQLLPSTVTM